MQWIQSSCHLRCSKLIVLDLSATNNFNWEQGGCRDRGKSRWQSLVDLRPLVVPETDRRAVPIHRGTGVDRSASYRQPMENSLHTQLYYHGFTLVDNQSPTDRLSVATSRGEVSHGVGDQKPMKCNTFWGLFCDLVGTLKFGLLGGHRMFAESQNGCSIIMWERSFYITIYLLWHSWKTSGNLHFTLWLSVEHCLDHTRTVQAHPLSR